MSGRLIILPKKRWHVWNREAIAKVRNDEKKHQEETEAADTKQQNLESEARLELLRSRSVLSLPPTTSAPPLPVQSSSNSSQQHQPGPLSVTLSTPSSSSRQHQLQAADGHINLFADAEHAMGQNEEHKVEKIANDRVEDKRTGYAALALGGTREEREKQAPWWGKFIERAVPNTVLSATTSSAIVSSGLINPSSSGVPLQLEHGGILKHEKELSGKGKLKREHKVKKEKKERKKHHKKKKHAHSSKRRLSSSSDSESSEEPGSGSDAETRKRKRKSSSSSSSSLQPSSSLRAPSLAELRAKRLERERVESLRAGAAIAKHVNPEDEEAAYIARHATKRYNSQFFTSSARSLGASKSTPAPPSSYGPSSAAALNRPNQRYR